MNPLDVVGWALAAVVAAFAIYIIIAIIMATIRTVRKPKPTDKTTQIWGNDS